MKDEISGGIDRDWPIVRLSLRWPRLSARATMAVVAVACASLGALITSSVHIPGQAAGLPRAAAGLPGCQPTPVPSSLPFRVLDGSWLAPIPGVAAKLGPPSWPATIHIAGLPAAGVRRRFQWISSRLSGRNDTSIVIGDARALTKPLSLDLETSDPRGSSLNGISFTEPRPPGYTSTSGIRLQAPLPWLQLHPYQSALVNSYDCEFRVTASRPTTARRWELRVEVNVGRPVLRDFLIPTSLTLQTDVDRPPFHQVQLDVFVQSSTGHAHLSITSAAGRFRGQGR